jgi:hypothetical protein
MMPRLSHSVYWGSWSWKASRFSQPFLVDPRATSTHLFTGQFLNETAKGKDLTIRSATLPMVLELLEGNYV